VHATVRFGLSAGVAAAAVALLVSVPSSVGTSWAGVLGALEGLPVLTLAVLAVLWIAGLTCNSVALAASLPGLTTRRALTLSLSGSAVANLLPLGGAAGVGLNYAMTRSWGFSRKSFAAYTATTNVVDVASKLAVVAAASAILLVGGDAALLHQGATAALQALLVLPVLGAVLLHQPSAARLGRALDRLTAAVAVVTRRPLPTRLQDSLPHLSAATVGLIQRGWGRLAVGTISYAGLQVLLLWACMHAAGLDLDLASLAGAFAVDRLLTLLPLTPGGLGLVEGGMAAALTALGAASEPVVLGVVLYRAFTYLAEIPVGGLTAMVWRLRRRRADRSPQAQPPVPAEVCG
jgi:putative heme transporter